MIDPAAARPPARKPWTTGVVLLLLAAVGGLWWWGLPRWRAHLETLGAWYVKGGPIVAEDAAGQLVLATIVAQERPNWQRPTPRGHAKDFVVELQLNRPDASDAGRAAVHRSEASVLNVQLLGTDRDRVWIFVEGLRAVSLSGRGPAIDPAGLAGRFPALRGQLSDDVRHYEWRPSARVRLVTRAGHRLDLGIADWTLAPAPAPTPVPQARNHDEWLQQMAEYEQQKDLVSGPRSATIPGEYGLDSWRAGERWIGLLTDTEQARYSRSWARPQSAALADPVRRRIWLAAAGQPVEHPLELGAVALTDMRPAGDQDYLRGGVLRDGVARRAVTIPSSPDVLIEHYTAVDATASVQLTRITPDGTERWTATLPLALPRTVAAAGDYVVLTGFAPGVSDDRKMRLVSVRLADGAIGTYAYNP